MDNVTHSLIGVLLARTFGGHLPGTRGVTIAAILASNLPDLDLVARIGAEDPALSYLVHHRGYTHTLVTTPLSALLAVGVGLLADPACRARPAPLFALSLLAAGLHIGADSWNNYGVHPFWPFWNGWLYGDTIFIVEPLLWVTMVPLLVGGWRWVGRALGAVAAGLSAVMLGIPTTLGVLGWWGLSTLGFRRVGIDGTWLLAALVFGSFALGSELVERRVVAALPGLPLVDVARTPRPAAPWCWSVLVSEVDRDVYRVRRATVSLLPHLSSAEACQFRIPGSTTFVWDLPDRADRPDIDWDGVWAAAPQSLPEDCRADVFLRFARIPAWQAENDVEQGSVIGDLRYDFEPELGFAEVPLRPGDTAGCAVDAPWSSAGVRALMEVGGRVE